MYGMIVLISAIIHTEVHALKNRRITAIVLKYASSLCVCVDQIGAYCIMVGRDQAILFYLEILLKLPLLVEMHKR